MRNKKKEELFLDKLKSCHSVEYVNQSSLDVKNILKNLIVFESPDFIYKDHWFEKFEVTSFQREQKMNGKKESVNLRDEAILEKQASEPSKILNSSYFCTPDNRSNTRHLKKNINDLIQEKMEKIPQYEKNYPGAKYKNLIIVLKDEIEIFTDGKGKYFSQIVKQDNLQKEVYQVYRDYNFIKKLKQKYSAHINLLIFVIENANPYSLFCIDLNEDLNALKMINYPNKIFQLIIGAKNFVSINTNQTTNIQYKSSSPIKPILQPIININDISLVEHGIYKSAYHSRDEALWFDVNNIMLALNPDTPPQILMKYIPLTFLEILVLKANNKSILLKRDSSLGSFFVQKGQYGYYRLTDKRSLMFTRRT